MKVIDLFAGIGGFSLAAHWMGWETIAFVERDKFCQKVLTKNFSGVPIYGEIKQFSAEPFCGIADIVTGGFPCQPYSLAGKQQGKADERDVSGEMLRVIRESMPRWVVAENVRGLLSNNGGLAFENICADLENEGYEVQPFIIPANCVYAEHQRERVWIIGRRFEDADFYTDTPRRQLGKVCDTIEAERSRDSYNILGNISGFSWFQAISRVHGVFNGISRRMDSNRNRVLGNSLKPKPSLRQQFKPESSLPNF